MPCLLALIAWFFPRLVIILLALTGYIQKAFHGEWWWPVLGFFLMPFTTLGYAFSINHGGGVRGIYLVLMIVCILLDFGVIGGSARSNKRRRTKVITVHKDR